MPDKSPPKFRRRSDARPDEILDAALDQFLANGYARTTMDAIAKAANLSKGAVYLYFPSKEALLEGLVRRAVVPIAGRVISALSSGADHPRETISLILRSLAQATRDPKVLAVPMLVVREAPNAPNIARIYREHVISQVMPAGIAMLDAARKKGTIRDLDPELTFRSIIGPLIAHALISQVFGMEPEEGLRFDRLVENHLSILFDGLLPKGDTA